MVSNEKHKIQLPWGGVLCTRGSVYPKWVIITPSDGGALPFLRRRTAMAQMSCNRLLWHPSPWDPICTPIAKHHDSVVDALHDIWKISPLLYGNIIVKLEDPQRECATGLWIDFLSEICYDFFEEPPTHYDDKYHYLFLLNGWYGKHHKRLEKLAFMNFVLEVHQFLHHLLIE